METITLRFVILNISFFDFTSCFIHASSLIELKLKFSIRSLHVKNLDMLTSPDCVRFNISVSFTLIVSILEKDIVNNGYGFIYNALGLLHWVQCAPPPRCPLLEKNLESG